MTVGVKVGDRVSTPYLTVGTVLEVFEARQYDKAKVAVDGEEEPQIYWVDSLRLHDPEAELERVLVRAEWSESSDALMLAAEVRRLRWIETRVKAALDAKQEQVGKSLEAAFKASVSDDLETGSVWGHTKVAARFKREAKELEGLLNG